MATTGRNRHKIGELCNCDGFTCDYVTEQKSPVKTFIHQTLSREEYEHLTAFRDAEKEKRMKTIYIPQAAKGMDLWLSPVTVSEAQYLFFLRKTEETPPAKYTKQ